MSNSDDRSRRKTGTKSSGSYGLVLGKRIKETSEEDVDKARANFEQAVADSPPPPSAREQCPSSPEHFPTEPSTTPSMREAQIMGPTAKEIGDATVTLTQSVDEICQALVLVFGKIEDLLKEVKTASAALAAVSRVLTMLLLAQLVVFGLMGYMVYRIESVVRSAEENRVEQAQTSAELRKLAVGFIRLQRSAEDTKRTVDEVATKADESPKVEIVPDKDRPGSAVVRILPPVAPPPAAYPSKGPGSTDVVAPPVEIPIRIDKARPAPDRDATAVNPP